MTPLIIVVIGAGLVFVAIGIVNVIGWGDLSSPKKTLDQFEIEKEKKYRYWTLRSSIISVCIGVYLYYITQQYKYLLYIGIEIILFIPFYFISKSTPSKKFNPADHQQSSRLQK